MFLHGLTQDYSPGVFNMVAAVWFFAAGYLLLKNVNRRMHRRTVRVAANLPAASLLGGQQAAV